MKRLLFLLLLIPVLSFGQNTITYGGKVVTYAPSTYCAEYQAVYDAYTTKPDAATAAIWNTCVEAWLANGEWVTKDVIYVYAAHTNGAGEALINWKNPGTFDASEAGAQAGNFIFTAHEGLTSPASGEAYINHNWNPTTDGVNFAQNSATMLWYIRTTGGNNGRHGISLSADHNDFQFIPRYGTNMCYAMNNCDDNISAASLDASGMWINTRTGASLTRVYRNKAVFIDGTTTSTGTPTVNPYTFMFNDDDTPTGMRVNEQVSLFAAGAGMTQTQVNNFTDPFETAMDALGTGIIP